MRVVALVSGGKDSSFNMLHCVANGHEISVLANLRPPKSCGDKDEQDSMMFQTVGHDIVNAIAECMQLPLLQTELLSDSVDTTSHPEWEPEVLEMFKLLKRAKEEYEIQAVSVGAILSNYQRIRVESVCSALGLVPLSYLWQRDQRALLEEMTKLEERLGFECRLCKIAAMGLKPKHLGKSLLEMKNELFQLESSFGIHPCGEGGEYESITLYIPHLFRGKKIVLDQVDKVIHSDNDYAPVWYLKIKSLHLEPVEETLSLSEIRDILTTPEHLVDYPVINKVSASTLEKTRDIPFASSHVPERLFKFCNASIGYSSLIYSQTCCDRIEDETRDILNFIQGILSQGHNLTLSSDATMLHVYVRDMGVFDRVNSVYREFFGFAPPSRACVQMDLPLQDRNIAIALTLVKGDQRESLHVQGISYWAPANIGPYSQAIKVRSSLGSELCHLAGVIGLIPKSMVMADSCEKQLELVLKSEFSLLNSLYSKHSMSGRSKALYDPTSSLCRVQLIAAYFYIVNEDDIPFIRESFKSLVKGGVDINGIELIMRSDDQMVFIKVPRLPRNGLVELSLITDLYESTPVISVSRHTIPWQSEDQLIESIKNQTGKKCLRKCEIYLPSKGGNSVDLAKLEKRFLQEFVDSVLVVLPFSVIGESCLEVVLTFQEDNE